MVMAPLRHHVHDPAFTIAITPADKLVEIVMIGFWDPATLERFNRQLRAALAVLPAGGCPLGRQVTLFDLTRYQVQHQQTLEGLAAMAADPTIGSRRIAVLLASALLRQQARRTAPGYGLFDDRDAAMAWLSEDDAV